MMTWGARVRQVGGATRATVPAPATRCMPTCAASRQPLQYGNRLVAPKSTATVTRHPAVSATQCRPSCSTTSAAQSWHKIGLSASPRDRSCPAYPHRGRWTMSDVAIVSATTAPSPGCPAATHTKATTPKVAALSCRGVARIVLARSVHLAPACAGRESPGPELGSALPSNASIIAGRGWEVMVAN